MLTNRSRHRSQRLRCLAAILCMGSISCAARTTGRPTPQSESFERGMSMYYGFDYGAAARWFEQAAREAPESALPYWGIALALGPNLNDRAMEGRMPKASSAVATARTLARGDSTRARDLIDALAVRYTTARL